MQQQLPEVIETLDGQYSITHYDLGRSTFTFSGNNVTHTYSRSRSGTKRGQYELFIGYELDWDNAEEIDGKYIPLLIPSATDLSEGYIIVELQWNDGSIDYAEYDKGGYIAPGEALWWRAYPHLKVS